MKNAISVGLCEGRHELPSALKEYIFKGEINPLNITYLENKAFDRLWSIAYRNGWVVTDPAWNEYDEEPLLIDADKFHINLYVTGLTVALVAVLNVCRNEGISVTLMHFDRESGEYYPQEVAI